MEITMEQTFRHTPNSKLVSINNHNLIYNVYGFAEVCKSDIGNKGLLIYIPTENADELLSLIQETTIMNSQNKESAEDRYVQEQAGDMTGGYSSSVKEARYCERCGILLADDDVFLCKWCEVSD